MIEKELRELELCRIALENILLCAQFIENMTQERHFLWGDGGVGDIPKGILHIDS